MAEYGKVFTKMFRMRSLRDSLTFYFPDNFKSLLPFACDTILVHARTMQNKTFLTCLYIFQLARGMMYAFQLFLETNYP